jgi:hypothetical protein
MSIIRDLGVILPSLEERPFVTCSTGNQAPFGTGTTGNVVQSSQGAEGIAGRVIDRLSDLYTKDLPLVAAPFTHLYSSRGSTAADRKITLGVKLQHGDSSGGGDMADYSTQAQPDDKNFFSTARTTEMIAWSTGALRLMSNASYYDLRAAKRFIRAVHYGSKNAGTTESTGDEGARFSGGIAFLGGNTPKIDAETAGSTSTST